MSDYRLQDPIEVVKYGLLYRARVDVPVSAGSPYRSMFMSFNSVAAKWGFSVESSARRCSDRRRRIINGDDAYRRDRKERTIFVDEGDLR